MVNSVQSARYTARTPLEREELRHFDSHLLPNTTMRCDERQHRMARARTTRRSLGNGLSKLRRLPAAGTRNNHNRSSPQPPITKSSWSSRLSPYKHIVQRTYKNTLLYTMKKTILQHKILFSRCPAERTTQSCNT